MSFSSQRTLASLVAGAGLLAAYTVYAFGAGLVWSPDLKRVAVAMLVFIGIGVGAVIVVQIAFHVFAAVRAAVREGHSDDDRIERWLSSSMVEDEMHKLVSLKASQAAAVGAGAGMIALLAALAWGASPAFGLHLMLWCCGVGSLVEGVIAIWFHQHGVRNG
ncbi:MAG: hypothetical protein LBU05_04330 [Bifidobacteriaceae bacterium]|jgi:hypothetical protein|nr:hypothetical protein [Bifidobacteriaceae bacterium]